MPSAILAGAICLYCHFSGTSIWDLLYVSRSSLASFRKFVSDNLAKLGEEMKQQKENVLKAVAEVTRRQDNLKDKQVGRSADAVV